MLSWTSVVWIPLHIWITKESNERPIGFWHLRFRGHALNEILDTIFDRMF